MTGVGGVVLPYLELARVCLYALWAACHALVVACVRGAAAEIAITQTPQTIPAVNQGNFGPVEAPRSAVVNCSDFLAWKSEGELASDLRLPPLAARKLLACGEGFLAAA